MLITGVILYGPAILFYFSSVTEGNIYVSIILYGFILILVSAISKLISKGLFSIRTFIEISILILGLYFIYLNNADTKNIIIIIIGTILYAITIFTNKHYSKDLNTVYSTFVLCSGVALFFLGISLLNKTFSLPANAYDIIKLLFIGIVCTALPILLIIKSLSKLTPLKLSALIVVDPIISGFFKAGGISNEYNLKQSIATVAILLIMLIHKATSNKKKNPS